MVGFVKKKKKKKKKADKIFQKYLQAFVTKSWLSDLFGITFYTIVLSSYRIPEDG